MDAYSVVIPANIWAYAILGLLSTIYAIALQTERGKWLATDRTWYSVVAGCGMVLLMLLSVLPFDMWLRVVAAFFVAGLPMVIRSINNDWKRNG